MGNFYKKKRHIYKEKQNSHTKMYQSIFFIFKIPLNNRIMNTFDLTFPQKYLHNPQILHKYSYINAPIFVHTHITGIRTLNYYVRLNNNHDNMFSITSIQPIYIYIYNQFIEHGIISNYINESPLSANQLVVRITIFEPHIW